MSKSLVKSAATVTSMTMVSRIFGFIRDVITAQIFGAGIALDAFSVAFKIPNLIRQLFAEGSLSQAFVPVLAEYQKQATLKEMRYFINAMAGTLGLVLLIVTVIGVLFAPWIIRIVAPGFDQGSPRFDWAVMILRITFPYLMFISLAAFSGAILNTYNRFWVAAFTPVILNIFMIGSAYCLAPYLKIPITALAWAVFVAGIFQLWFQWHYLKPLHLISCPTINFHNSGVKKVLKLMLPAIFGVSISQINLLFDTIFASFLVVGSVSWLYYADRLMDMPLGVFGVAISTVILPNLSRCHASNSNINFSVILDWALRCILLVGVPATIIFVIMAGPLLSTLFQHGKFDGFAVMMARKSLVCFSFGIIPFLLVKILVTGFYARQDMRTPVRIGIWAVIFNIALNMAFIWSLEHAGIALATSIAALLNVIFLYYYLRRLDIYQPSAGWKIFSFRLIFANVLLALWLGLGTDNTEIWISHQILWRSMHLIVLLLPGLFIYIVGLWLAGIKLNTILIPMPADPEDIFDNESLLMNDKPSDLVKGLA